MHRAVNLVQWVGRHRQALLFFSLIATIAVGPVLTTFGAQGTVLNLLLGLTLLTASLMPSHAHAQIQRRGFVVFVAAAIVLGLAPIRSGLGETGPITLAAWSAIAFFGASRAFGYATSSRRVDRDHLLAALNAYLLVGVFLGAIWVALEETMPGSLVSGGTPLQHLALPDGIYFSFVTLATLGYGDISPATPIARGIAVFEAIFGQLYLAVMVARLVSLRIAGETLDAPP